MKISRTVLKTSRRGDSAAEFNLIWHLTPQSYQDCIDACQDYAVSCDACAEACLDEQDVMMVDCIRLDRDCAKISYTATSFMASGSAHAADRCQLCAHICEACAEECRKHEAHMDHCRQCAEACRKMARVPTRYPHKSFTLTQKASAGQLADAFA